MERRYAALGLVLEEGQEGAAREEAGVLEEVGGGLRLAGGEGARLRGYAAVFDALSVEMWGFWERIERGAFGESLKEAGGPEAGGDVVALWQHDTARVLGRTGNGSLRLWEDEAGLGFELWPADTQDGRDALTLIRRGDVRQMSFGFQVLEDAWGVDEEERIIRTLKKIRLIEISPVTFPAYPGTEVGTRGAAWMGERPVIPAEALRAQASAVGAGGSAGRLGLRRRRLMLAELV